MRFQPKAYLLLVLVVQIASVLTAEAQNFHFSDQHEHIFKSNPAAITRIEKMAFQLSYRNQWPGNSDFVTYDGAFFFTSERFKSSVGLYIYRDSEGGGIINLTGAALQYGYRTAITREWHFAAGIQASYSQYSTNFAGLTFENPGQNTALDERYFYFDFASGVELQYRESSRFGLALTHIGAFQSTQLDKQQMGISLSYEGHYPLKTGYYNQETYIEPLFYSQINTDYNELMYGARVQYKMLYGGFYIRQNLRFQFDAAIILLGIRFANAALFYTYDVNLSGVNSMFTNLAAHEVTFFYELQYNRKSVKKSRKRGAIKCPNI